MTEFFSNNICGLDLVPKILDRKLLQDIVAFNIYVKLYQNLTINEGSWEKTKFFLKIAIAIFTLYVQYENTILSKILSYLTFV